MWGVDGALWYSRCECKLVHDYSWGTIYNSLHKCAYGKLGWLFHISSGQIACQHNCLRAIWLHLSCCGWLPQCPFTLNPLSYLVIVQPAFPPIIESLRVNRTVKKLSISLVGCFILCQLLHLNSILGQWGTSAWFFGLGCLFNGELESEYAYFLCSLISRSFNYNFPLTFAICQQNCFQLLVSFESGFAENTSLERLEFDVLFFQCSTKTHSNPSLELQEQFRSFYIVPATGKEQWKYQTSVASSNLSVALFPFDIV